MNIQLKPKHAEFFQSTAPYTAFVAGVGSGKTTTGDLKSIDHIAKFPLARGFIAANTRKQLHKSTLPPFLKLLNQLGWEYVINCAPPSTWGIPNYYKDYSDIMVFRNGCHVYLWSLERWETLRGIEIGWAWIDETQDSPVAAFDELTQRLRGMEQYYPDWLYKLWITATPDGFNWLFDKFSLDSPVRLEGAKLIQASTMDGFLPIEFAETLVKTLGKQLARQQILGEFLNLAVGRAFAFERTRHVLDEMQIYGGLPIVLTCDFNVAPMCATILQYAKPDDCVHALDEVIIKDNALSRDVARQFALKFYPDYKDTPVHFYGDIAGKHRDTRGGESDHLIITRELKRLGFTRVINKCDYMSRRVKDGVNAVNALLDPATGNKPRLKVNPKCTTLIRDLEQVAWKPGTTELDKSNGQLTHATDNLRYYVVQEFPIAMRGAREGSMDNRATTESENI